MTTFTNDLKSRIDRFRLPNTPIESLYPIFEAVNNAFDAINDKYQEKAKNLGKIEIKIDVGGLLGRIASVTDNGIGLDSKNFEAYQRLDTPNKIEIGGKGVGRLYWLQAFKESRVESIYRDEDNKMLFKRSFTNTLNVDTFFKDMENNIVNGQVETGTTIYFNQFRENKYREKFPKKEETIVKQFVTHFLPRIISPQCPKILLSCGGQNYNLYKIFNDCVVDKKNEQIEVDQEFGEIQIQMLKLKNNLRTSKQYAYLIANGRTVQSSEIDKLIGFKVGDNKELLFNVCISGEYFDRYVTQDRTSFALTEQQSKEIRDIVKKVCEHAKKEFLKEEVQRHEEERLRIVNEIIKDYPSVNFDTPKKLLEETSWNNLEPDQMYGELSRKVYRRHEKNKTRIKKVLDSIRSERRFDRDFDKDFDRISAQIKQEEKNSLTEYIVRRKAIIDIMQEMLNIHPIEKITGEDKDYILEKSLHKFLCPMGADSSGEIKNTEHNLWVIDERLTFAKFICSDKEMQSISIEDNSSNKPDLIIFDQKFTMKNDTHAAKILIVEFKRPGREKYELKDDPDTQFRKYIDDLYNKTINKDITGRPLTIDKNTIIYCYVIADILGQMEDFTRKWSNINNGPNMGSGKILRLGGDYINVTLELIQWDELLDNAKERHQAFFEKLGIAGSEN